MIVWLAEGALLSAIVDEVDMGFSCLWRQPSKCSFTILSKPYGWERVTYFGHFGRQN
jgi:hypothetical protein